MKLRLAVCQINTTVGDLKSNCLKIKDFYQQALEARADLAIFPELVISGYPPRDLLQRIHFNFHCMKQLIQLAEFSGETAMLVGYPHYDPAAEKLYNAAALLRNGRVEAIRFKSLLPTYDVFDENRYFTAAVTNTPVEFEFSGGLIKLGITICEDAWDNRDFWGRNYYTTDPLKNLKDAGAEIILNLSASPFVSQKPQIRYELLSAQSESLKLPFVYCNSIGGNDELVFDGNSMLISKSAALRLSGFKEELALVELDFLTGKMEALKIQTNPEFQTDPETVELGVEAELLAALGLGLTDYLDKCGFKRVILGLSGGIDSALCAAICQQFLPAKQITGVLMPSPYSSKSSLDDALELVANLGINHRIIPIEPLMDSFQQQFRTCSGSELKGLALENLQARIRGNILMSISNTENSLLISTGNKSELAVGYCTLYGDMAGGLSLISDLPKLLVYRLSEYLNQTASAPLIPQSSISKAPSAELAYNQKDTDSLPEYSVLDRILYYYIQRNYQISEIIAAMSAENYSVDRNLCLKIIRMIDRSEYKRRQASPGIKLTSKAFGSGRRMPIAVNYRHDYDLNGRVEPDNQIPAELQTIFEVLE